MATLQIRLKRKKSSGNSGIVLSSGEAYYNIADHHLYIGNKEGDDVSVPSKKHVAQITPVESGSSVVSFQIGEDKNNVYKKEIIADNLKGTINSALNAENVTSTLSGTPISDLFTMSSNRPVSALKATSAKYSDDDSTKTIGDKFTELTTSVNNIIKGTTVVSKSELSNHSTTAHDVTNLSLDSSSGATIKLTWGKNKENSTSFTVNAGSISGVIDSARNVTEQINGNLITDIFDGTSVKKANQLKTARRVQTDLSSSSSASFNGTSDIKPGVTGILGIVHGGTGATTADGILTNIGITASATELSYTKGLTESIRTTLNKKQNVISGAASTVTSSNLTSNRVLISNSNGKISSSDVTSVELGFLDGVTSNIQTQLDDKASFEHGVHVTYSTISPKLAGEATPGTASSVARSDHVHPAQTSVSGNAGTATKLKTSRTIELSGDVTGSTEFDGSNNVAIVTNIDALKWKEF